MTKLNKNIRIIMRFPLLIMIILGLSLSQVSCAPMPYQQLSNTEALIVMQRAVSGMSNTLILSDGVNYGFFMFRDGVFQYVFSTGSNIPRMAVDPLAMDVTFEYLSSLGWKEIPFTSVPATMSSKILQASSMYVGGLSEFVSGFILLPQNVVDYMYDEFDSLTGNYYGVDG